MANHEREPTSNGDQSEGWFKATRGQIVLDLIRASHHAYVLAAVIAHRARWNSDAFNPHNLSLGEAEIGDHDEYGMTRQEYRTALAQLTKWNFAATRTTSKGTIAKLIDTRLFDPLNIKGNHQNNQPATSSQPSSNQQPTTNQEGKEPEEGKEGKEVKDTATTAAALILEFLNQKTGSDYQFIDSNLQLIKVRLSEVNGDVDGIKQMIERQCALWGKDDKMVDYLRVTTLFGKTKFQEYFSARKKPVPASRSVPTTQTQPDHERGF